MPITKVTPEPKKAEIKAPAVATVSEVIGKLDDSDEPKSIRDLAVVLPAVQRGLRRSEISALTVEDINLDSSKIAVQRKGKREKQMIDTAGATREALERWLAIRDQHANKGEQGADWRQAFYQLRKFKSPELMLLNHGSYRRVRTIVAPPSSRNLIS